MVKLSLVSPKGNQGVRYFPYKGYLGLTPLRFEGLVRTHLEQDAKPILAKDVIVAVRCYESRQGRFGTLQTNVLFEHSVTLWQKCDTQEWSELGDAEFPFRFSVPSHIVAPSTALYFQEYRIFWRIEAALNHIPISAVGSRQVKHFDLPLVRYDAPAGLSPPTPSSSSYMTLSRSKARGPPLRYCILVPPNPIGPLDIISVQLIIQPLDPSASIRSASAFVERRIHFNDSRLSPSDSLGPYRFSSYLASNPPSSSNHSQDRTTITDSGTSTPLSPHPAPSLSIYSGDSSRPLLQHHESSADDSSSLASGDRRITHIFAHAESEGRFSRDSSGVWRHNLVFSWPDTKSSSRWAVGESVQTSLASVKFFLRVKLIVSSPASSAETVELEDKELTIVSTNDLQRQLALSRYTDWVNTASIRPKSKPPRGPEHDRNAKQLPSPPRSPRQESVSEDLDTVAPLTRPPSSPEHSHRISTASSPYPVGCNNMSKVSRRPHTSAGPRDRSGRPGVRPQDFQGQSSRLAGSPRPETAHPTRFPRPPPRSHSFLRQKKSAEAPRMGSEAGLSSDGHSTIESSQHDTHEGLLFDTVNLVDVEAWEQELVRIESASRRNSADMLGFMSQRKKVGVEPPSIPAYLRAEG